MVPSLCPEKTLFPSTVADLDNGYILLRKRDRRPVFPQGLASVAISNYLGQPSTTKIYRWARLRLPNGQIARTAWRELLRAPDQIRPARFVKVCPKTNHSYVLTHIFQVVLAETTRVVEVQYFTRLAVRAEGPGDAWIWKNVAVVTMFSPPSPTLFKLSYQTVYACQRLEDDVHVIDVTSITGVVGMALHRFPDVGYCYFMVE
ncbi:hypothetical protein M404DRAFT_132398 [Pisolithus tinctorius Marx 270]|uniref:Uncharacterized protein n=1 Tax=Pisolithus tinctorius Marx 270 TaxID=870435 RepID=A0A0C3PKF7_PISTI|nr:hypothetical protein M404DRAFT_132398 [Pisolithus tinctorius Marx 270]